jgi:hypothetical protein
MGRDQLRLRQQMELLLVEVALKYLIRLGPTSLGLLLLAFLMSKLLLLEGAEEAARPEEQAHVVLVEQQ